MNILGETAIDLMAANYTVVGLILIYHLFAIQHWLGRLEDVTDDATSKVESQALTDVEATYLRSRCEQRLNSYPLVDVIILGLLILCLSYAALVESRYALTKAPQWLTLTPVAAMLAAYIAGSVLAWARGRGKVREVLGKLPGS